MRRFERAGPVALVILALSLPHSARALGEAGPGGQEPRATQAPTSDKGPAAAAAQTEPKEVIVYLGMDVAEGVSVSPQLRQIVEAELLSVFEMDRFELLKLRGAEPMRMDDLVDALRKLGADRPPEPKPAWAVDLDRINSAAYFCELYLSRFELSLDEVRAGQKAVVSISAAMDLYKLDRSDPARPEARHVAQIGKMIPITQTGMLQEQGQLDAQLTPMVRRAAKNLAGYLSLQLRRVPEFEIAAKLLKAEDGDVFLPMGSKLGVELGDAYLIRRRNPNDQTQDVAYAKVREVKPDSSRAQVIARYDDWSFQGDEIAIQDDQRGIALGAAAVLEYTGLDLFGNGGPGFYPGFDLTLTSDLSASVDWSEFHLAIDLDYLAVGAATKAGTGTVADVHLGHATIGLLKKWAFGRLALQAGLRAGFAFYIYPESGLVDEGAAAHLGFGGDLVFGTELFVARWATLGLRLVGRYFSNPVDWVSVPYDEIALRIEAGLQFTF